MSLNQKYTWNNFLKENPEFKEKKVKRTSSEGKKAFESAFKARSKEFLKSRLARIEKEVVQKTRERDDLTKELKAAKKPSIKRTLQTKVGTKDSYICRLGKMTERTKQVQKNI